MTLTYEITPTFLPGQVTAVMRAELPPADLPEWLQHAFRTVYEYLDKIEVTPQGPPFARYTFLSGDVAVEAGVPVRQEIPGNAVVEPSRLPDGPAAVTVHFGRYEDTEQAYEAVLGWLEEIGYEVAGPHWEVYRTNPYSEPDPARWRTDVVVPYRMARLAPEPRSHHEFSRYRHGWRY